MLLSNRENRIFLIIVSIIITLDQISKYIITLNYDYFLNKKIFIFSINYVRNYGAAFNIFEGNRVFLSLISIISSLILIYFIYICSIKELLVFDKKDVFLRFKFFSALINNFFIIVSEKNI